jgi:eukaryotic-like serine/threonine-protein kinase
VQLDDSLCEAHAARGLALAAAWRWGEAEAEFRRAIAINPNNTLAHYHYAFTVLTPQNRLDQALEEFHVALSLDPLSPIINTNYSWTLMVAHRYDESLAQYRKLLQRDPDFGIGRYKLSHLYASTGRFADALNELYKSADRIQDKDATPDVHGYCVAMQSITRGGDRNPGIALACASTDRNVALRALAIAYEGRELNLSLHIRSSEFDPLRSDPRYIEIMRNMGLNP